MKKIIFGLIFLLLVGMAFGQNFVDELKSGWGEVQGTDMPGFAKTLFGDERINIHLTFDSGEVKVVGLETVDGQFMEFSEFALDDPTLNVYGAERVVQRILSAESPIDEFRIALDNDEITYEAIGVGNKIKLGVMGMIVRIGSWFT